MGTTPTPHQHPLFNTIRVAVSRYNKKTGENWQVTVMGMTCKVVEAVGSTKAATAEPDSEAPQQDRPTKFEFIAYLETMGPGQSFTLPAAMEHRFDDLCKWTVEYEEHAHKGFVAEFDGFKRELTVKRPIEVAA